MEGVAGAESSRGRSSPSQRRPGHPQDVDGDSDVDLVLHFRTQDSGIQCGDTTATLVGSMLVGDPFTGSDGIATVGCS